ncbi:MAG TPA: hypothetical protein VMJ10_05055 [Kofleriaceae bacterium]|nr:hypothetical protein [Kofleriaceae bacterium]
MLTADDIAQIRALIREELARAGVAAAPAAAPAPAPSYAPGDPRIEMDRQARIGLDLLSRARDTPGGMVELQRLMTAGADRQLRLIACARAGELGDDALLPIYERLTADTADRELYDAAFEGLFAMWSEPPLFQTASKAAYKLTTRLLERKPRAIPVGVIVAIHLMATSTGDRYYQDWLDRAPWFKPAAFGEMLGELVLDSALDPVGRGLLVEAIAKLGASRRQLERLRKQLHDVTEEDRDVAAKLAEVIAASR